MSTRPWRESAACYGHPFPELWDQWIDGESSQQQIGRHARAKTVCDTVCPVKDQCLAEAMHLRQRGVDVEGIWGGHHLDAINHHKPGKRGPERREINHGTEGGYQAHLRRGETACDECRDATARALADRRKRMREGAVA